MYQVLYRKYRPKVFSDVYGQDHITHTLRNEIQNGRVSHAYLFTGSRGTGKTTCAKILAKAVNCENPQNGEPCNECATCRAIDSGKIYDVVEIDAASNNKVDDVRVLREEVTYTPSMGKYRVFIIDEVHMLSNAAFNALLKTLEEPPAHIIFVLATTEVQELPATILSRCQRFDFKRIQSEVMSERLHEVAQLEGMELQHEAALLIARIADGALRDGLSILDQCAGRGKVIDEALVSEVAGLAGRDAMFNLSACIAEKDGNAAVRIISELYNNSYDMERLCGELIGHFRNLLMMKTVRNNRDLMIATDDEYNRLTEQAEAFTTAAVIRTLDLLQDTLVSIKGGATARIEMELAFIKLCDVGLSQDIDALLERISVLERAMKSGAAISAVSKEKPAPKAEKIAEPVPVETETAPPPPKPEATAPAEEIPLPPKPEFKTPEAAPVVTEPEAPVGEAQAPTAPQETQAAQEAPAPQDEAMVEFTQWGELMSEIRKNAITLYSILNSARGYTQGDRFLIDSPNPTIGDFISKNNYVKTIKLALYQITGKKFRIGLKPRAAKPVKRDPLDDFIAQAQRITGVDVDDE